MADLALWRPNPADEFVQRHSTVIWSAVLVGGAFATGALIAAVARRIKGPGTPYIPYTDPPPLDYGVPFAEGDPQPEWPIAYTSKHSRKYEVPYKDINGQWHGNAARAFKYGREERHHAGVDLYANAGDAVLAPESGTVIRIQTFFAGTDAMLIQGDSGVTVLLGELERRSPKEFGIVQGSRVERGDPVARIGLSDTGSFMLHFETYACCPSQNISWYKGSPAPLLLNDPTDYLLRARAALQQSG